VPTPAELAQLHTDLSYAELGHLQRLLGSWSLLADLSFSDLLLLAPVAASHPVGGEPHLVVLGQIRPSNRPTLVDEDLVGRSIPESDWTLTAKALRDGEVVRGKVHHPHLDELVPVENIPVRFGDSVIAVMLRVSLAPSRGRSRSYERTYVEVFKRFATMVAESAFPFPDEDVGTEESPRVGDGVVVVDGEGRVEFASPNAINAFHRMGAYPPPEGRLFSELGIEESAVEWALAAARPVVEEVERRPDVIVLIHCIPLLSGGKSDGAVILMRDVTDVRRLDRLLLSKDAAIREVHHRVKNNLQTISSLLALQARRVDSGVGRAVLREAERRVRSIALVHEILSRDPGDQVPFDEIVGSLVRMAEDSVVSSIPVTITVNGNLGDVGADVATSLAVALAEILQNAVGHAFEPPLGDGAAGHVNVTLRNDGTNLSISVEDDGSGLPERFDVEHTSSLGLSIVRDLVEGQLSGSITMTSPLADGTHGTRVLIETPAGSRKPRV
jgi:two-component sensor histidine kinase